MASFASSHCKPFRRIITLQSKPGRIDALVADNVHQFAVSMAHHAGIVTAIEPRAVRVPWTTCPGALPRLQELVGMALDGPLPAHIDKAWQCTHLFDLARLAMFYARHEGSWRYDIHVTAGAVADTVEAVVLLDDRELQRWMIAGGVVVSDGIFHGHVLRGPARWPAGLNAETRLAALALRRAILVYLGSRFLQDKSHARELPRMIGSCHTFQPETVNDAARPAEFLFYPVADVAGLAGV